MKKTLCPTCKWLNEPDCPVLCALHSNPDKEKYWCFCSDHDIPDDFIRNLSND